MKKKYIILPALLAMCLTACTQTNTTTETTTAVAENTIDGLAYDSETRYTLYVPEKGFIDISKYLVDGDTPDIYVSGNIISDVFGFKILQRDNGGEDSEVTYLEYQNEAGDLLQIEENGDTIIHNGNVRYCAQNVKVGEDGQPVIKLLDLLVGIGYERMEQSSSNNNIITIAYRSATDPTLNLVYDENGELITDKALAEAYLASMSNAMAAAGVTETETQEGTESAEAVEETAESVTEETEEQ